MVRRTVLPPLTAAAVFASALSLATVLGPTERTVAQRVPPPPGPLAAVVSVGATRARSFALHGLRRGGARLERLGITSDPSGYASLFEGTDAPMLSPDGRYLAYRGQGRLRVRDLQDGSETIVPTTLDRSGSALAFGFALDSSSLLFFDMTRLVDADVAADEGAGPEFEGIHRIFVLASREVRTVALTADRDLPALLESASDLLVLEATGTEAPRGRALVRLHLGAEGITRTRLATTAESLGFGQLAADREHLAWSTDTGLVVADRQASGARPLSPAGTFAQYQRPGFAPGGVAMTYEHHRRIPRRGGFDVVPSVNRLDRVGGTAVEVYTCRSRCESGFVDDTTLLVLDGDALLRVGVGVARPVRLGRNVRSLALPGRGL